MLTVIELFWPLLPLVLIDLWLFAYLLVLCGRDRERG
jgi:hypothetical protein